MRESREQPLALGSFTNARCTKEDNSSRLVQSHSRRSGTFSTARDMQKKSVDDYSIAKRRWIRLGTVSKRLDGVLVDSKDTVGFSLRGVRDSVQR